MLALADEQLPYSNSPALQAARLGLAHDRALHRRDVRQAARLAAQMVGLADPADSTGQRLRYASCDPDSQTSRIVLQHTHNMQDRWESGINNINCNH